MKKAIATLARLCTADQAVDFAGDGEAVIGKTYEVDLHRIGMTPILHSVTKQPMLLRTVDRLNGEGALPLELLDFDAEDQKVLDDMEWPEELPDDADRPRMAIPMPAFNRGDPFSGIIEMIQKGMGGMFDKLNSKLRPTRVKLISATSTKDLENRINEFLASGPDIASISDRTFRFGNELVKEVHYYVERPQLPGAIEIEVPRSDTAENSEEVS